MKFSTILLTIMMVGMTFLIVGLFIQDFNNNYLDINKTDNFSGEHDYTQRVSEDVEPLQEKIENIDKEESGWKIFGQGLVVLPLIVITFIKVAFSSMMLLLILVQDFAGILAIPSEVIGIALAMITVFIIFKLIGWWQRSDT